MKRIVFALAMVFATSVACAKTIYRQLVMDNFEMGQAVEGLGDELYLMVTILNSRGDDRQYSIPNYPVTWPSDSIQKIKDLTVWEAGIEDGESMEIIVELVEQDAPPFNVDDSLGSARIKLKNHEGNAITEWGSFHHTSEYTKEKASKGEKYKYHFNGHGGKYSAYFHLTDQVSDRFKEKEAKKAKQ